MVIYISLFYRLLLAEKMGHLCRDDSVEGLRFYPNLFWRMGWYIIDRDSQLLPAGPQIPFETELITD